MWTGPPPCKHISECPIPEVQTNSDTHGKVKTGQVEKPSIGVPSPARNRAIYDGRPAEGEDHGRHDATTFERSTNDELHGDCAEEHLVEAEDNFRKKSGAW